MASDESLPDKSRSTSCKCAQMGVAKATVCESRLQQTVNNIANMCLLPLPLWWITSSTDPLIQKMSLFFVPNLNKSTITSKQCEIGCQLVLITDRKSHIGLNDPERCNSPYFALFHHFVSFGVDCVKVVENRLIMSAKEM